MGVQLDRDTAESIVELMTNPRFERVLQWLDGVHAAMVADAINGVSPSYTPDVLRGRAQAVAIIKQELAKAPDVAARILKPHQRKPAAQGIRRAVNGAA